jgi:hypothetical protein
MKTAIQRFVIPLAVGMIGGAAIALVAIPRPKPESAVAPAPETNPVARDDVALLKTLLAERDTANAELRAEIVRLKEMPSPAAPALLTALAPTPTGSATNSWLDRIRVEDPERYRQIQAAREQRRQAVEEWFNSQFDRLDQRLQAAATKEEGDLVTQIAEALQQIEELGQRWQEIRALPEEQRRAAAAELGAQTREAYRTLSELRAQDRQFQLQQLARQIGYRDERSAAQFVDAVTGIIKETEVNPLRGMGWGGGRGGPAPQP